MDTSIAIFDFENATGEKPRTSKEIQIFVVFAIVRGNLGWGGGSFFLSFLRLFSPRACFYSLSFPRIITFRNTLKFSTPRKSFVLMRGARGEEA